ARERGLRRLNLGLTPLSRKAGAARAPLWRQLGTGAYPLGWLFADGEALRAWAARHATEWAPRYLAYPKALELPVALADLATLNARRR
ncbi:MAG: hypothetical protein H0W72_08465, partial [Planctomycetes bacterium]|nr:hypothetical protein [Planctomycetota bacterium]